MIPGFELASSNDCFNISASGTAVPFAFPPSLSATGPASDNESGSMGSFIGSSDHPVQSACHRLRHLIHKFIMREYSIRLGPMIPSTPT